MIFKCHDCESEFDEKYAVYYETPGNPRCPVCGGSVSGIRPADLPEAGASAERISSVVRALPSLEEIDKAVDDYGFQVPYDGTNDFYDKERMQHFKAGIDFVMKYVRGQ